MECWQDLVKWFCNHGDDLACHDGGGILKTIWMGKMAGPVTGDML